MTEAELVEMEKLVESATPGPWRFVSTGYIETFESEDELHRDVAMLGREGTETDGKLLAASRAFVPAAIAEIRRLRRETHRVSDRLHLTILPLPHDAGETCYLSVALGYFAREFSQPEVSLLPLGRTDCDARAYDAVELVGDTLEVWPLCPRHQCEVSARAFLVNRIGELP